MNYKKIYDQLINRAKNRKTKGYSEKHHIIPRCVGGDNSEENLVRLTPEEHYVAHQLLIKIYPKHSGLIWAALQMTGHPNGKRSSNKLYGWLKRKYSLECKKRTGRKNGSYGKMWIYSPISGESKKIDKNDTIPNGWKKGRASKYKDIDSKCHYCNKSFIQRITSRDKINKYCSDVCRKIKRQVNATSGVAKRIEIPEQVFLERQDGATVDSLSQKYGINKWTLYDRFKKLNIKPNFTLCG